MSVTCGLSTVWMVLTRRHPLQPPKDLLESPLDLVQGVISIGWKTFVDGDQDSAPSYFRELLDANTHDVVGIV